MRQNPTAATAQIAKLQDQADMFTRKIEMEKRRVAELDKQTALMNQKIMEQRKKMGGINAARENNQQIQKQIKVLENRLEKALVKYNEAIAHNKKLRGRIDNLRRERLVYDQIHKKLEKELESKKEEMKGIVEISEAAYESRENALAEMTQLKQQALCQNQRSWARFTTKTAGLLGGFFMFFTNQNILSKIFQ